MAVSRLNRPLERNETQDRDATLIIVATEGEKTEPLYFTIFSSTKLQIVTLNCPDGHSSPEAVLGRATEYKSQFQFGDGDSFWVVVDRDKWTIKMLSKVYSECRKSEINLIVSNPAFEIWLSLHYENDLPKVLTKTSMTKHLKDLMGSYTKSSYPLDGLLERSAVAIERAKSIDKGTNKIWPEAPGTRLYQLMMEIHSKRLSLSQARAA
jgi:hypothetical protein